MPLDKNYPRVDGELKMTRARMAEVKNAGRTASDQTPVATPARTPSLPSTAAAPTAPEVKAVSPGTSPTTPVARPPSLPATTVTTAAVAHKTKLPAAKPATAEKAATLPATTATPAAVAARSVGLPATSAKPAEAATHAAALPSTSAAPIEHNPAVAGRDPFGTGGTVADLVSRIVWRNGPQTRR